MDRTSLKYPFNIFVRVRRRRNKEKKEYNDDCSALSRANSDISRISNIVTTSIKDLLMCVDRFSRCWTPISVSTSNAKGSCYCAHMETRLQIAKYSGR